MALSEKDRKQLLAILIVVGVALPVLLWFFWRGGKATEAEDLRAQITTLQAEVDSARAILRQGRSGGLQNRIEYLQSSLRVMDQLVPVNDELPSLIDNITERANLRGVEVLRFDPETPEASGGFEVRRYRLSVIGGYDQIGEFLSDVASLPRIMVPYSLSLQPAENVPADLFSDSTVAALQATFLIRTFVKGPAGDQLATDAGAGGGSQ